MFNVAKQKAIPWVLQAVTKSLIFSPNIGQILVKFVESARIFNCQEKQSWMK